MSLLVSFSHFGRLKRFEKTKAKPDKIEQRKEKNKYKQNLSHPLIHIKKVHSRASINICHFKITKMLLFRLLFVFFYLHILGILDEFM